MQLSSAMLAIKNLTVIGAGQMGAGIAQVAAVTGHNVCLNDLSQAQFTNFMYIFINIFVICRLYIRSKYGKIETISLSIRFVVLIVCRHAYI